MSHYVYAKIRQHAPFDMRIVFFFFGGEGGGASEKKKQGQQGMESVVCQALSYGISCDTKTPYAGAEGIYIAQMKAKLSIRNENSFVWCIV